MYNKKFFILHFFFLFHIILDIDCFLRYVAFFPSVNNFSTRYLAPIKIRHDSFFCSSLDLVSALMRSFFYCPLSFLNNAEKQERFTIAFLCTISDFSILINQNFLVELLPESFFVNNNFTIVTHNNKLNSPLSSNLLNFPPTTIAYSCTVHYILDS